MQTHTETFYRTYGPMVLRRCRALLRNEQAAQDAMQDVFVQVLLHEERLDDRAPSSLLYRIATNVCLNKIRSTRRRPEDGDPDLLARIASAQDELESAGARSILRRLFGGSDDGTAAMAVMHLMDGLTLEQVAEECGMSVSGVRKRLRKLKARVVELDQEHAAEAA